MFKAVHNFIWGQSIEEQLKDQITQCERQLADTQRRLTDEVTRGRSATQQATKAYHAQNAKTLQSEIERLRNQLTTLKSTLNMIETKRKNAQYVQTLNRATSHLKQGVSVNTADTTMVDAQHAVTEALSVERALSSPIAGTAEYTDTKTLALDDDFWNSFDTEQPVVPPSPPPPQTAAAAAAAATTTVSTVVATPIPFPEIPNTEIVFRLTPEQVQAFTTTPARPPPTKRLRERPSPGQ